MTPAEVLTKIKDFLISDGMIATDEAAQSYIDSRVSEWDITEDVISEIGGDEIVNIIIQELMNKVEKKLAMGIISDKTQYYALATS